MRELRLSLKTKWFLMTDPNGKTEDYREINEYWIKRLMNGLPKNMAIGYKSQEALLANMVKDYNGFKKFDCNTMTLGYPKSTDTSRIKKYEHLGIEIGYGKEEWGAEQGKLYFIIKHGKQL